MIYKYYDPDFKIAITKVSEITANVQKMKQFFAGIRPRSQTGDMWFQIYIGFNEEEDEIEDNTDWWYSNKQSALYCKQLQVQKSVQKIWLLCSHEKINLSNLQEEINTCAARKLGFTVPMALVDATVKDGRPWKASTRDPSKKPMKATLIETKPKHQPQANNFFLPIWIISNLISTPNVPTLRTMHRKWHTFTSACPDPKTLLQVTVVPV